MKRFARLGLRSRLWLFLGLTFLLLHSVTALLAHRLDDEQAARMVLSDHASSLTLCLLMLDPLREGGSPLPELLVRLRRLEAVNARILHTSTAPVQVYDAATLYLRQRIRDSLKGFVAPLPPNDASAPPSPEPRAATLLPWSKDMVSRYQGEETAHLPGSAEADHFPPSISFWLDNDNPLEGKDYSNAPTAVPPWVFVTRVSRDGPTGLARLLMLPGTDQADIYISQLFVRLDDKTWLDIQRISRLAPSWPLMLTMLAVEALVIMLLAMLVVHRLVKPLHQLALATETLGRDGRAAPLAESGPPEVAHTARAFNRMSLRIRAALEQHERMLSAVAHDLRTPLTRLRLRVEQVEDETMRRKLQADINTLSAIMRSSHELGQAQLPTESLLRTDLAVFLLSLLEDRQAAMEDGSGSLRLDIGKPPASGEWIVPIRAHALHRCLDNLLENARRYASHIVIRLHCHEDGRTILVDVDDDGPGIPREFRERVFEPFFRLDPARGAHDGGSGLGLAIARSMARQNNADLSLLDSPEGGLRARLSFHVPVFDETAAAGRSNGRC